MSPDKPSTEYIESAEVGVNGGLTIPEEIQKIIFSDDYKKEGRSYCWYIHKSNNNKYIFIANHTPREENSHHIKNSSPHDSAPNRTTIPIKVRDIKDINQGDSVYFHAHDEVEESKNPSVAVLTENQLTHKLDSETDPEDTLYQHRTYTTLGIDGLSTGNIDEVLDEILDK